jgi:hypothetical protein
MADHLATTSDTTVQSNIAFLAHSMVFISISRLPIFWPSPETIKHYRRKSSRIPVAEQFDTWVETPDAYGFTAREEIPLKFHLLSDTVYTIQPERPLDDGEYLVIFGPSAPSGFEFQIACSGAHCD